MSVLKAQLAVVLLGASGLVAVSSQRPSVDSFESPGAQWIESSESALAGVLLAATYGVSALEIDFAPSSVALEGLESLRGLAARAEGLDLESLQLASVQARFEELGEKVRASTRRSARITRQGGTLLERHFFGGPPVDARDLAHELAILGTPDFLWLHLADEPSLFVQEQDGSYSFLELSHLMSPLTVPGAAGEGAWFGPRGGSWTALPRRSTFALSPRSRLEQAYVRRSARRIEFLGFDGDSGPLPVLYLLYEPEEDVGAWMWIEWNSDARWGIVPRRVAVDRVGRNGSRRADYLIWDWRPLGKEQGPFLEVDADTIVRDQRFEPLRVSRAGDREIPGMESCLRIVPRAGSRDRGGEGR